MEINRVVECYECFDLAEPADELVEDSTIQPLTIAEVDGKHQLVGYAVVWGAISGFRQDGYKHQFNRGSIVWNAEVEALWSHLFGCPLASTRNGTLTITEDDYGAKVAIVLDDTTDGQNALQRVQSGLVSGMSFGGSRNKSDFTATADPQVIQPFNFLANEVSLTVIPAVKETKIVTAKNHDLLEKEKTRQQVKRKLNNVRLVLTRPR